MSLVWCDEVTGPGSAAAPFGPSNPGAPVRSRFVGSHPSAHLVSVICQARLRRLPQSTSASITSYQGAHRI